MSHYPPLEEILAFGREDELFRVYRSVRAACSEIAVIIFTALIAIALNVYFEGYLILSQWGLPDISLRWLALIPTFYVLSFLRGQFDTVYIFGSHGVAEHKGRLSLNKTVPYVKYADILALRVHQDPWGRALNYGSIDLDTSAEATVEMVIDGIVAPKELGMLLDELRRRDLV
jgi:hypothetical protein